MNAQILIDECNTQKFNPKQFRDELNISWLINDVKKQFNIIKLQQEEKKYVKDIRICKGI